MAESSRGGGGVSMILQKKRKHEQYEGGENPPEGLVKLPTLPHPDPDISVSGSGPKSVSSQGSNAVYGGDLLSSIDFEEGNDDDNDGRRATMAESSRLQKKPKFGEPKGEDLQRKAKVQALPGPDPEMEGSKSGSGMGSTQGSNSICGGELLPLNDLDEEEEEDDDADDDVDDEGEEENDDDDVDYEEVEMTEEELKEWWKEWWKQEKEDFELPKSPGWGYSDVDEDDPDWHDKFRKKCLRETPPKYKALLDRGYCLPGVEKKDEALWERYLKQIEDSDGYDITEYPGPTLLTPITPLFNFKQCPSYVKTISELTDAAIKKFNSTRKEDDQYEVHDILTANISGCRYSTYYITFEAKKQQKNSIVTAAGEEDNEGGAPLLTTFQARVLERDDTGEVEVHECRIKGLKPSPA